MTADLTKIPGAGDRRSRPAVRRRVRSPRPSPTPPNGKLVRDPRRAERRGGPRPPRVRRKRTWRRPSAHWFDLVLLVAGLVLGGYLVKGFWDWTRVGVDIDGVADGAYLQPEPTEALEIALAVDPADRAEQATVTFDGEPLGEESLDVEDGLVWVRPGRLAEGEHTLAMAVPRPMLGDASFEWNFTVDGTPPVLDVVSPVQVGVCDPVAVSGEVEPGTELLVNGEAVDHDDRFTLEYDRPPAAPLALAATDAAGNVTQREVVFATEYPGAQGIHVTAAAWGYEPLRQHVLALVDAGIVSVVELDLKDEDGIVGYDSEVPLALDAGAVRAEFDLEDAVEELHDRGVGVVGRVVAFRDQPLTQWAWNNGHGDWVVQTTSGQPHDAYGGFSNFAHPDVRRYNIDIALEGAAAGVDEILWDYVRRPEGDPNGMVFPGLTGTPEDGIVTFAAEARAALREECVLQGFSVFGIAADRPWAVGQDVARLSRHADYLAPMLYPSHWVNGEYGVGSPNRQPYEIVAAALADFQAKAAGSGVTFVPWLQDFSLGHPYGPAEVRAQIDAAASVGVTNWLLWNAGVQYTPGALDPRLVTP